MRLPWQCSHLQRLGKSLNVILLSLNLLPKNWEQLLSEHANRCVRNLLGVLVLLYGCHDSAVIYSSSLGSHSMPSCYLWICCLKTENSCYLNMPIDVCVICCSEANCRKVCIVLWAGYSWDMLKNHMLYVSICTKQKYCTAFDITMSMTSQCQWRHNVNDEKNPL